MTEQQCRTCIHSDLDQVDYSVYLRCLKHDEEFFNSLSGEYCSSYKMKYPEMEKTKISTDITNATTLTFEEKMRGCFLTPEQISPGWRERMEKRKENKED